MVVGKVVARDRRNRTAVPTAYTLKRAEPRHRPHYRGRGHNRFNSVDRV